MRIDLSLYSDEQLSELLAKATRAVRAMQAAEFADLSVARYEYPSRAVDRALEDGFDRTARAQRAVKLINDEIARRAA